MSEDVTDLTRGVYRRIYSGYITGRRISKLSLPAEAWFWRVQAKADDFGNARADPDLCKDETAGLRRNVTAKQISGWLREMADAELIQFYTVRGEPFLHIVNFEAAQPAGKNGKRMKRYPSPDESEGIQVNPDLSSASDNDNQDDNHNEDKSRGKSALVSRLFEFWKTEMNHPKAQLTSERKKRIEDRLKDSTVEEIETAIRGCKASDFHMGREPGHAQVFDDIELICRKRSKLESFIAMAPRQTNGKPKRTETVREKMIRESCERCFGTGTDTTDPKGAKHCDHGNAVSERSGEIIESSAGGSEARVS